MKTDHHQTSAKIYIFPAGRQVRKSGAVQIGDMRKEDYASFVDTDSWYHQDAIEEFSGPAAKRQ